MKKMVLLSLLLLFGWELLLYSGYQYSKEVYLESVFEETKEESRSQSYYLKNEKGTWTSYNLEEELNELKNCIIRVYPKNDLSYLDETMKRKLQVFSFRSAASFEEEYLRALAFYGLEEEQEKFSRYGVPIFLVEVYTSKEEMTLFLKEHPTISLQRGREIT